MKKEKNVEKIYMYLSGYTNLLLQKNNKVRDTHTLSSLIIHFIEMNSERVNNQILCCLQTKN